MRPIHAAVIAAVLLFAAPLRAAEDSASAPEIFPLAAKVFDADYVVEVELLFGKPVGTMYPSTSDDPRNWQFPPSLIREAMKTLKIVRNIKPSASLTGLFLPGYVHILNPDSPCWWEAHRIGRIHALIFLHEKPDGTLEHLAGTEAEWGQYCSLNPEYNNLVAAVQAAVRWQETAPRKKGTRDAWKEERAALQDAANPYLPLLADAFLERAGAMDVVTGSIDAPDGVDAWRQDLLLRTGHPSCVKERPVK